MGQENQGHSGEQLDKLVRFAQGRPKEISYKGFKLLMVVLAGTARGWKVLGPDGKLLEWDGRSVFTSRRKAKDVVNAWYK